MVYWHFILFVKKENPMIRFILTASFIVSAVLFTSDANAQNQQKDVVAHAIEISSACPGNWTKQSCMSKVSDANQRLAVNYIIALENRNKKSAGETVKQKCAASTASREREYPAEAVLSAYTECANTIYDVTTQTGIKPDQDNYQLLVAAVLCMSDRDGAQCQTFERQMRAVAGR